MQAVSCRDGGFGFKKCLETKSAKLPANARLFDTAKSFALGLALAFPSCLPASLPV
jgi:hypothetical protein